MVFERSRYHGIPPFERLAGPGSCSRSLGGAHIRNLVACAVQQQARLHQSCLHFTESEAAARIAAYLRELRQVC
jgi:hypothetical protein